MARNKDLAEAIVRALQADPKATTVTEVGPGIYGIEYDGVGYSLSVNVTP